MHIFYFPCDKKVYSPQTKKVTVESLPLKDNRLKIFGTHMHTKDSHINNRF